MEAKKKIGAWQIDYVDYGIANRFPGKYIEMHEKLRRKDFQPLHKEIIIHEKEHTDKGYKLNDFLLDLKGFKQKKLYWKFILTTPSAWAQFSPLYKSKGKWYFDISVIVLWLIVLSVAGVLIII